MERRFGRNKYPRLLTFWFSALLACCHSYCNASQTTESVTLAWNQSPSANVVGYNIYYGGVNGNYTSMVSVGNVTNVTISGLLGGVTYYFAAAAINSSGLNSGYSSQISYTPPATTTTNSPLLNITNVISGMVVSNAAFTVMGHATDNIAVADVYYSLDNALFAQAATANGWTNWNATLTLTAGTNTFAAYALDTSGNTSTTSAVNIVYAPYMTLIVHTHGQGSVSPIYNGSFLQIGKAYSMTAAGINGFMFTNWTGGASGTLNLYTNGPTVTFTMISNLVMRANFVDTNAPWLSITNVTPGIQVSNTAFTVTGLATDNVAVASVYYSLDSTPFTQAVINGATWSAALTLTSVTNTFAAYAIDTSGNISMTDNVSFAYVQSGTLNLQTGGRALIVPNYSNAVLRVGQNYTMTAYPDAGFVFTNWTGGSTAPLQSYGKTPTVTFMMQSNLTMQANFIDLNKPWLSITNTTSGMVVWSNANYTVTGLATDDQAMASVNFSLNGAPYQQVSSPDNWTNWSATLALSAGTNIFSVYALATNGNFSATDTVDIVYAVSNQLNLQTAGNAIIYPNYSNAWLRVGQNYTMTAYPDAGFVFTNWTGGNINPLHAYGNSVTVTFMMLSNMTMQANFIDLNKPWLSITNTTSGMVVWSNANYTVTGLATDDQAMASVNYSFNGAPYTNVLSSDGWTNWNAPLNLTAGTNLFSVYALAANGNFSATDTVSIVYAVSNQLNLQTAGKAIIYPNYSNAWLRIGQNYTVTAYPNNGFIFSNWTEGASAPLQPCGSYATVTFMMQTNLTLQANLIEWSKPTLTISSPLTGTHMSNSLAAVIGTTTDPWGIATVSYRLNNGAWTPAATTNSFMNWTSSIQLVAGTNTLNFYAVNLGGNYSATNNLTLFSSNAVSMQLTFGAQQTVSHGMSFNLSMSPNLSGHILVSTDLVNWSVLTTFTTGTNSTISFYDPNATNSQRFYRAVSP
jgi:hypothetical protein